MERSWWIISLPGSRQQDTWLPGAGQHLRLSLLPADRWTSPREHISLDNSVVKRYLVEPHNSVIDRFKQMLSLGHSIWNKYLVRMPRNCCPDWPPSLFAKFGQICPDRDLPSAYIIRGPDTTRLLYAQKRMVTVTEISAMWTFQKFQTTRDYNHINITSLLDDRQPYGHSCTRRFQNSDGSSKLLTRRFHRPQIVRHGDIDDVNTLFSTPLYIYEQIFSSVMDPFPVGTDEVRQIIIWTTDHNVMQINDDINRNCRWVDSRRWNRVLCRVLTLLRRPCCRSGWEILQIVVVGVLNLRVNDNQKNDVSRLRCQP